MIRLAIVILLVSGALYPMSVVAHHGWSGYGSDKLLDLAGG